MKLFWIDMEMTGLDVTKEVILEVGAIITDLEFNELDSYHSVVKQPQRFLDAMDDWNQRHHRASGLLELIPSGKSLDRVENDLLELLEIHFANEKAVIAGNSISQDRAFIQKYFVRFAEHLHYRMLDVTAWKVVFNNKYQKEMQKNNNHRAIDDIRESIKELQFYLSFVKA